MMFVTTLFEVAVEIQAIKFFTSKSISSLYFRIDDYAKGGLTQFWELFTMIPCAPKY